MLMKKVISFIVIAIIAISALTTGLKQGDNFLSSKGIDTSSIKSKTGVNNDSSQKQSQSNNEIELTKCVDGDTAYFTEIGKTRFLLIDTPESTNKIEPYGKEASKYTCNLLSNAKSITYEYDGSKKDKYDRTLAYIFVDGKLIQDEIAKAGYVKKLYLYQSYYKYESEVKNSINDRYGVWEGY